MLSDSRLNELRVATMRLATLDTVCLTAGELAALLDAAHDGRLWMRDARTDLEIWALYNQHEIKAPQSAARVRALVDRCPLPPEECDDAD